jgi:hypothetical protein
LVALWRLEEAGMSTLFTCQRSLRSLPHLSALQAVCIFLSLSEYGFGSTASLRCILRSVMSLPLLQRLEIEKRYGYCRPTADWTDPALPITASLQHVKQVGLSFSAPSSDSAPCLWSR